MSDMIYRLVLKARFEDEAELERALRGLDQLQIAGANVNVSIGKAGKETSLGLQSIAQSALRAGYMVNMLESAYMRQTMAQLMATNAQERYNTVVEKFGINSKEAAKAAEQLRLQTQYLNLANIRANVSTGLLVLQLALQSKILNKSTLALIYHTIATKAQTVADWLHNAALASKAILLAMINPLMTMAMIGAGTLIAGYIASEVMSNSIINIESQINLNGTSEEALQEALKEHDERALYEYRRSAGG